jgi:hypothetical protein
LLPLIKREVPFESLIRHLEKSDRTIQQNTLALMNSLFVRADAAGKDSIAKVEWIKKIESLFSLLILLVETGANGHREHCIEPQDWGCGGEHNASTGRMATTAAQPHGHPCPVKTPR